MNFTSLVEDPLFQVEHKIAQRADELSRRRGCDRDHALECWEQAEREYWEGAEAAAAPARDLASS